MIEKLTIDDFKSRLGETFTIHLDSGEAYGLVLESVKDLGEAALPDGRRPFSLELTNPRKDAYLPQQIYLLEHPQLGGLELFIVPLGPVQHAMRYEVVFG